MIIGNAFSEAFNDFTIEVNGQTIEVKNTFDDQYALDKFIAAYDEHGLEKFPLVFCVTGNVEPKGRTKTQSKRQIVIMAKTRPEWLSKDRNANTYTKVIEPIYNQLIPIINKSSNLKVIGDRKVPKNFIDRTNYGASQGKIGQKVSKESVVTEYIDARIVELTLEYNPNKCNCTECII